MTDSHQDTQVRRSVAAFPRSFRWWASGSLASQFGDIVMMFALGWAATAQGGGAAGLVLTAMAVPRALLLLVGGVLADRWHPKAILLLGDGVMLAAALILVAASRVVGSPLWLLVCFGLVAGAVSAVYGPMSGTIARRLVADEVLPRALAAQTAGAQTLQLAGPPIAGVLVGLIGLDGVAAVDAATFAVVIAAVLLIGDRLPGQVDEGPDRASFLAAVAAGFRTVVRTPGLGAALALLAAVASFGIPVSSLLVPLLARSQHWPAGMAGLLVACQAVGSIGTSLCVARRGPVGRPGVVAAASTAPMIAGLSMVALLGAVAAPVGMFVFGVGLGLFVSHFAPAVLSASPRDQMSRVQSIIALVQTVPILATNNLLGAAAARFDPRVALLIAASVLLATGVFASRSTALRNLGATTSIAADRDTAYASRPVDDSR